MLLEWEICSIGVSAHLLFKLSTHKMRYATSAALNSLQSVERAAKASQVPARTSHWAEVSLRETAESLEMMVEPVEIERTG